MIRTTALLVLVSACARVAPKEAAGPRSAQATAPTALSELAIPEVQEASSGEHASSATAEPQAEPPEVLGMVYIPAGSFIAGKASEGEPPTEIELGAYYIDRLETSVDEYAECVTAGICREPSGCSRFCTWKKRTRTGNHAINCIAWSDAQDYCGWRGKRLPNELEWEKAARGVDGRLMPWGDKAPADTDEARPEHCKKDAQVWTRPRGCNPADVSPYGLRDTAWGVFEWVMAWTPETELNQQTVDSVEASTAGFRGGSDRVGSRHWEDLTKRHGGYSDWTSNKRMSMFDRPGVRCAADGASTPPKSL